jgi:hypothetical protein
MNAKQTYDAVVAAHRADRGLTSEEDQALRHWSTQVSPTGLADDAIESVTLSSSLTGVAELIRQQGLARDERARVAREHDEARRHEAAESERVRSWREEPDRWTRAFALALDLEPGNKVLQLLTRSYEAAGNPNAPTPTRWRPELIHPVVRARLGLD